MQESNNYSPQVQPVQPIPQVYPVQAAPQVQPVQPVPPQPVSPQPVQAVPAVQPVPPQPVQPVPAVQPVPPQPVSPQPVQAAPQVQPVQPVQPVQAAPQVQPVQPVPPQPVQPVQPVPQYQQNIPQLESFSQNYNNVPAKRTSGSIVWSVINIILASLNMLSLVVVKIIYICKRRLNSYEYMDFQYNQDKYRARGYSWDELKEAICDLQDLDVHYNFIEDLLAIGLIIAAVWLIVAIVGLMIKRCKAE